MRSFLEVPLFARVILVAYALVVVPLTRATPTTGEKLLLAVQINGQDIGEIGEFIRSGDHLYVKPSEMAEVGLRKPARALQDNGSYVDLSSLPCLTWRVEDSTQTLLISAKDQCRRLSTIGAAHDGGATNDLETGSGSLINYAVSENISRGTAASSGSIEARSFTPLGVLSSSALIQSSGEEHLLQRPRFLRLDTSLSISNPSNMRRYIVGDFITGGLAWSRPVRVEGLQIRSDFSMRPDLVTFPLPSLKGSAAVPTTLQVLANETSVLTESVASGPFEVPQVPVVTGAGTLTMNLTNMLGEQQTVNVPFYASSSLLAPGLSSFAFQMGKLRENWGSRSDAYGSSVLTGAYRMGVNQRTTIEGTMELTPHSAMGGGGVVLNVLNKGVVSADLGSSVDQTGSGMLLALSAQRIGARLSVGATATLASAKYGDVAATDRNPFPRQQLSANVGISTRRHGSLDVAYMSSQSDPNAVTQASAEILSANYSCQLRKVFLVASSFVNMRSSSPGGATLGVTLPLGHRQSVSVSEQSSSGWGQIHAQQSTTSVGEWGYQAYANGGVSPHAFVEAAYESSHGTFSAALDRGDTATSVRVQAQGALVFVDRSLFLSNPINDSFAVVDTNGLAAVHVLQDHRDVGKTDAQGKLLMTDLRSFDRNKISILATDVPLSRVLEKTEQEIRIQDRAGIVVRFPSHVTAAVIIHLIDRNGVYLQVGGHAQLLPAGDLLPIGYDGEVYLENVSPHSILSVTTVDGSLCQAEFDHDIRSADVQTIGSITCR